MDDQIKVHVIDNRGSGDRKNLSMRYVDPVTGKQVKRSTGTSNKKAAERAAAVWQDELNSGRYFSPHKILWSDFRDQYEAEKLSSLAKKTLSCASAALNHLERVINPKKLATVTPATMSRFQAQLRKEGLRETSIACHLRHVKASLNWGVSMGMMHKLPDIHMPKRAKGSKLMRGRPICEEEFARMLKVVPQVRPRDPGLWQQYLTGVWLSGLRLTESTILSWDDDTPFAIDLSGRYPRFRIYAEAEKGNRDRYLPMTPDFAEWILQTPEDEREGLAFKLTGLQTDRPITPKRICRTVTAIGKAAGVVVNRTRKKVKETVQGTVQVVEKEVIKYASCHDLRRSFGSRWAPRIKPATLQLLMRHASIQTTLAYYVALDSDDVASELWAQHAPKQTQEGTVLGTAGENGPQESLRGPAESSTEPPCGASTYEGGGQGTRTLNRQAGT